jgi:hypothetical protein
MQQTKIAAKRQGDIDWAKKFFVVASHFFLPRPTRLAHTAQNKRLSRSRRVWLEYVASIMPLVTREKGNPPNVVCYFMHAFS